ncbi:DMT family transporter [Leifsonia poae]|uniref:DMT family transporter n=1 Tax=Leifsonia poae TaxID=110933 RepID=UPI001CBE34D7|nr:DMT family transporter [Leifsonia poae]
MVLAVVLALGSSLVYGVSDFFGAVAARRLRVLPSTTLVYALATVAVGAILLGAGGSWTGATVLSGSLAGVFALVGMVSFYAALAAGPMTLLAPVIALLEAVVPISAALVLGVRLSGWAWVAIGIAVIGTALISIERSEGRHSINARAAGFAVVSGVALGLSVVALDAAPTGSGFVPAFLETAVGLLVLLVAIGIVGLRRSEGVVLRGGTGRRRAWIAAAGAGALLGVANALLIAALHTGNLAAVGVLVSLYPLSTIVLARILLKERITPVQSTGIVLALSASVLLGIV